MCGKPRKNNPCIHLKAALDALADFDARMARTGDYGAPLEILLDAWLKDGEGRLDPTTLDLYRGCATIFREFCKERDIRDAKGLNHDVMVQFKTWMKAQKYRRQKHTLASRACQRQLQYLRSKDHLLRTNPALQQREQAPDFQAFLEDSRERFLANEEYVTANNAMLQQMEIVEKPYSIAYVMITLRALRTAFFWAIGKRLMPAPNPLSGANVSRSEKVISDSESEDERNPLTDEEVRIILDSATGRLRDMAELMLHTGMRIGEVVNLPWKHVRLNTASPHIQIKPFQILPYPQWHPKWKIKRDIPLNKRALELLGRLRSGGVSDYVFSTKNNTRCSETNTGHDFRKLFDKLYIVGEEGKGVVPHCFRHTFATKLVYAGVSPKSIQGLMGHKSLKTTLLYFHRVERRDSEAVAKLEY